MITGEAAVVCFPTTTAEVAAAVRVCRRPRPSLCAPWLGHRPGRRRHPGRRRAAGRDRHHQDEPDPRGRRRPAAGLGPAGRAQPRPVAGRRPPRPALRPRPVQPAVVLGRRQPGQQLRRSALPALRRHQRPHPGRRGRPARRDGRRARRPRPRARRARPAGRVRRQRRHHGHRHPHRRPADPAPPAVATLLADFSDHGRRRRRRDRHHRRRDRPGRPGDDGRRSSSTVVEAYVHAGFPTDAAAVLLVEVDGLPGGVEEQTAGSARSSGPIGAGTVRVAGGPGRAGPVVEGPQVGVRGRRPDRPQLLPARLRGASHPAGRGARRGRRASRPGTT